jgi:hypothetical protein
MFRSAEQSGFLLERVETITPSEWLYFQWLHLLTFPKECSLSHFWSGLREPSRSRKAITTIVGLSRVLKLNHFITRLFDMFQLGDNYIFVLKKK